MYRIGHMRYESAGDVWEGFCGAQTVQSFTRNDERPLEDQIRDYAHWVVTESDRVRNGDLRTLAAPVPDDAPLGYGYPGYRENADERELQYTAEEIENALYEALLDYAREQA
jgi:hypothetical protein